MATVRYTVIDGEVISEKRSGVRRQYVPDPLGSTVALLDNTQTKTDTFSYWPYGEEATRTGSTSTAFRYVGTQGYYRDSETKIYVRARYLSNFLGRWYTPDPLEKELLAATFSFFISDAYQYVRCNPYRFVDPSGFQRFPPAQGNPFGYQGTKFCGATQRCPPPNQLPDQDIPKFAWNCIDIGCGYHDRCLDRCGPNNFHCAYNCDKKLCNDAKACAPPMNWCWENGRPDKSERCKAIARQIIIVFCKPGWSPNGGWNGSGKGRIAG